MRNYNDYSNYFKDSDEELKFGFAVGLIIGTLFGVIVGSAVAIIYYSL